MNRTRMTGMTTVEKARYWAYVRQVREEYNKGCRCVVCKRISACEARMSVYGLSQSEPDLYDWLAMYGPEFAWQHPPFQPQYDAFQNATAPGVSGSSSRPRSDPS